MPVDVDGVITLINVIASEEEVKICVKQSFKGSLIAGTGAFLGGLMGGPPGLLLGGILGSGMGYAATKDQFVSIVNAIEAMPMYRKQRIAAYVQDIVDQLDHSDLVILTQLAISVATGGPEAILRHQVLGRLARNACDYIRNQVAEEQAINPDFLRQ